MTCCDHCVDAGRFFNTKTARKELRKFNSKGPPNKSTRLLIAALKERGVRGKTLLDVGGGVGMIQHELLDDGLAESMLVEASPAYLEVAKEEARRRGYEKETAFRHGDVVDLAPDLPEYDLVTLDRVICCYPHMKELVRASTAKASRWYGVVYPKERWYLSAGLQLANIYCWARGMDFRVFVHDNVDATIRAEGFAPVYRDETILWNVGLYERSDEGR